MEQARILVVEDEAISVISFERILRRYGYKVCESVPTGEQAIEIARREKPDVVLMDILLAGQMDGFEAAREIRSLADIPIVFLTGFMDDAIAMKANALSNVTLLVKPLVPEDLRQAILEVLEGRKK